MENGFFKWLWRFNAIAIAIAASGTILAFAFVLYEVNEDYNRPTTRREVVNTDPEDRSVKETIRVGGLTRTGENNLYRYSLMREQVYDAGYSSKSTYNNVFNYGFLDIETGASHWLLDKNDGLITWNEAIRRTTGDEAEQITTTHAWLYLLVENDTNDDKRLSESDLKTLIIAPPDGTSPQVLLSNIQSVISNNTYDKGTQIIVYHDHAGVHAALISIDTLTLEKVVQIPTE